MTGTPVATNRVAVESTTSGSRWVCEDMFPENTRQHALELLLGGMYSPLVAANGEYMPPRSNSRACCLVFSGNMSSQTNRESKVVLPTSTLFERDPHQRRPPRLWRATAEFSASTLLQPKMHRGRPEPEFNPAKLVSKRGGQSSQQALAPPRAPAPPVILGWGKEDRICRLLPLPQMGGALNVRPGNEMCLESSGLQIPSTCSAKRARHIWSGLGARIWTLNKQYFASRKPQSSPAPSVAGLVVGGPAA
jgi:hypothetical protein